MAVVVGVEAWAESGPVVLWAAREARLRDEPLTVVHSEPDHLHHLRPDDVLLPARERDLVADVAEVARHEGVQRVISHPVTGDVADRLLEAAPGASMVVVGHRHHGRARETLRGSVGLRVAAHVSCPVVVVPSDRALPSTGDVVVGVDLSFPGADQVLCAALVEARLRGVRLAAVAAYSRFSGTLAHDRSLVGASDSHVHDVVAQTLARVLEECQAGDSPRVPVDDVVVAEDPSHTLVRRARCAALVVVGSHGHSALVGTVLGSVPHQLLRQSDRPVVVVHLPRGHEPRHGTDAGLEPGSGADGA